MYEVAVQNLPELRALTLDHVGSYLQINKAFAHLCGWLEAHHAYPPGARLIAIYYDDPTVVPEANLRSCAGVVLPSDLKIENPFKQTEIRGGTYAVLRHKGPYSDLGRAYQWLYRDWLPQSGKGAAEAPGFEEYLNSPGNTEPAELLTKICIPLR